MKAENPKGTKSSPHPRTFFFVGVIATSLLVGGSLFFYLRNSRRHSPPESRKVNTVVPLEVCNMIAGNFKAKLSGMGNQCLLSVPTIITGGDYHMHALADGCTVEVVFEFEGSLLWITLELHS